jgi:hypothetical protein
MHMGLHGTAIGNALDFTATWNVMPALQMGLLTTF